MTLFIADGEFGVENVEADTLADAAVTIAKLHAGLESDEVCRDPFWFTIAPAETPDNTREFQAEYSVQDGLEVYDVSSGDLIVSSQETSG